MTDQAAEVVDEVVSSDRDTRIILALIAIVVLFAAVAARAASRRTAAAPATNGAEAS
jgi:hypothetical protein